MTFWEGKFLKARQELRLAEAKVKHWQEMLDIARRELEKEEKKHVHRTK